MRKLFRFKYEPCNGTCYVGPDPDDDMAFQEFKTMTAVRKEILVSWIVKAHDKLCDNPDYSFGIDFCEETGIFISHFRTPAKTDIYSGKTLEECVLSLCKAVISTDIPQMNGLCNFGVSKNENLAERILKEIA